MQNIERKVPWNVIAESVRGSSHKRNGLPNQDAYLVTKLEGADSSLILAVSDGHGSAFSFRSDQGARMAVRICSDLLTEMVRESSRSQNRASEIKRAVEEKLPKEIVREWREKIDKHLKAYPISPEELDVLSTARGDSAKDRVSGNPYIIYGATLLAALITDSFIIYIQLGDGDILSVSREGEIHCPIPRDERLIGNETTSLCTKEAWRDFYINFQQLIDQPPRLILLSTDGFSNSFIDNRAFQKAAKDFVDIIQQEGPCYLKSNLEGWLNENSEKGSGDDITVGILFQDLPASGTIETNNYTI